MPASWHRLCWQLVGTGVHWFHQMATRIWLPPSTGMKNLFSSHFFGDWLTVLWHSTLWLFVRSLVLGRLRSAKEVSEDLHVAPLDLFICFYCRMEWGRMESPSPPLCSTLKDTLLHIWGVQTARADCWRKRALKRCTDIWILRWFKIGAAFSKIHCILLLTQVIVQWWFKNCNNLT